MPRYLVTLRHAETGERAIQDVWADWEDAARWLAWQVYDGNWSADERFTGKWSAEQCELHPNPFREK